MMNNIMYKIKQNVYFKKIIYNKVIHIDIRYTNFPSSPLNRL